MLLYSRVTDPILFAFLHPIAFLSMLKNNYNGENVLTVFCSYLSFLGWLSLTGENTDRKINNYVLWKIRK